jgi:hypothetical protein
MADMAAITALSAKSKIDMAFVVTMTAYWFFVFYGGDGNGRKLRAGVAAHVAHLQVFSLPDLGHVADEPERRGSGASLAMVRGRSVIVLASWPIDRNEGRSPLPTAAV